ncbi:MAG TPA: OmpA family protein [Oligoflexia bacterium]|nr:OmpA family protein [Oligoflexia bacterium]
MFKKILFTISLVWGSWAFALNSHLIRPVGDQYGGFSVHGTRILKPGTFEVGSVFQYVSNPIDFRRFNITNQDAVENMGVLDSYFSLGFFDWLSFGALLPINITGSVNDFNNLSLDTGPSLGDLYLHATLSFFDQEKFIGLALVPFVTLPLDVNTLDQFNDSAPSLGAYLVLDKDILNKHYVAVNLGGQYRFEEEGILGSAFSVSHAFLYALAYTYHLDTEKNTDLFIEARGASNLDNLFTQQETMPIEALAGMRIRVFKQKLSLVFGGGKGFSNAYGSSDYRAFAGLSYLGDREVRKSQNDENKKPIAEQPVQAPVVAEKKPEVKAPEQISQLYVVIKDENKKLIMVDMDLVNEQGEVVQKFSGTSWRKNTAPGFYTLRVNKNGYEPIEKKLQLKLRKRHSYDLTLKKENTSPPMLGNKIDFLGRIQFNSGKATIRPVSYKALNEVAGIMKKYPQIKLLRIEAHTDSFGSDSLNLKLSQQRAASVEAFLLAAGIEASRLNAIGLGETQPIESNSTPQGRAKNRRVEFTVVKSDPVQGLGLKK